MKASTHSSPFLTSINPPPSFLSGSDSHYAIVHGTHPIAKQGEGIFPDGDEIVIFDADAVLPQVTVRLKTPNNV